jgi:hypothetical protein
MSFKARAVASALASIAACVVAVLAVSAVPAAAEFQSKQTQGKVHVLASGEFKIGTTAVVTCVASEIESQWHIQSEGQIKQQQKAATEGPILLIQVKSWGKCTTKISGEKGLTTEIKPCDLRMYQNTTGEASTGIATSCMLTIGTESKEPICEARIPAGMETEAESNEGINVGLLEAALNEAASLKSKVNVTRGGLGQAEGEGIFIQKIGKNVLCALPTATEKAELVGMELEAEGADVSPVPDIASPEGKYPYQYKITTSSPEDFTLGKDSIKCSSKAIGKLADPVVSLADTQTRSGCELEEGGVKQTEANVGVECTFYYRRPSKKLMAGATVIGGVWSVVTAAPESRECELIIKNGVESCNVELIPFNYIETATFLNTPAMQAYTGSENKVKITGMRWIQKLGVCNGFTNTGSNGKFEDVYLTDWIAT